VVNRRAWQLPASRLGEIQQTCRGEILLHSRMLCAISFSNAVVGQKLPFQYRSPRNQRTAHSSLLRGRSIRVSDWSKTWSKRFNPQWRFNPQRVQIQAGQIHHFPLEHTTGLRKYKNMEITILMARTMPVADSLNTLLPHTPSRSSSRILIDKAT
jgi:hypothetical protein